MGMNIVINARFRSLFIPADHKFTDIAFYVFCCLILQECSFHGFFIIILSGVRLSPFVLRGETESLGTVATSGLLYQPQMIGDGVWREIGGMEIGRGNRSTRRKPAPAPFCPPQIQHD
jgi:hypothetical protein